MKRAILYSRVSTPKQAELYSLDYQLQEERTYATDMGFQVVAEFRDDQSGRKMDRDGLTEARQLLAEDKADVLVVWKLDRLHRSYVNTVVLRDEIQRMGKELFYAQSRTKSGSKAKERLPEDILALLAEIEADEIAERTQMGKRQKALSGKWIGLNKPPYGYTSVGKGREVRIDVNEKQAEVVRLIFQWFVYGDNGSPLTTVQIAHKLTALGIPTPNDELGYYTKRSRGFAIWARNTIYRILRQSAYMGTFFHYTSKKDKGRKLTNFNKNEYVGVPFPIIVDEETFNLAQDKLTNGRRMSKRNTKYEYLFARRVTCECGQRMTGATNHAIYTKADGTVKEYIYSVYRCSGKRVEALNPCPRKDVRSEQLDERVWEYIKEEIANPEVLKRKLEEIQETQRVEKAPVVTRLETLIKHRNTIVEELRRLALLYARDAMPEDLLTDLISQQNQKLKLTTDEIERTEKEVEEPLSDDTISGLVAFSEDFKIRLESMEQDFEAKRTVVDGLDAKVTVYDKDGERMLAITTLLNPLGVLCTLSGNSRNNGHSLQKGVRLSVVVRL